MAFNKLPLPERLNNKILVVGECHIFQGTKDARGYGMIRVDGVYKKAHRASYFVHKGEIPEGFVVMHSCDVPACINPAHLIAAPQIENVRDMHAKGRAVINSGENHVRAKLKRNQVALIRQRYKRYCRKDGANAIGKEYGISGANVIAIIEGKTWK